MEIKGVVVEIGEIESGQGKKDMWFKQQVRLKTPGEYPRNVVVMFWGKQVDTITRINHEVTVHVNPESREYNGRWHTELRAWKVEQGSGGEPPRGSRISQEAEGSKAYEQPEQNTQIDSADDGSGLPF